MKYKLQTIAKLLTSYLVLACIACIGNSVYAEKVYTRPSDQTIKKMLTPEQYYVTQEQGTEPAFKNEYWNNKNAGIYVDIVTGEPLFSSTDKFDSKTGWPSFTNPIDANYIITKPDNSLFMSRIEVVSKYGKSHLGHLFNDGPPPTHNRYCINSASLLFIPVDQLTQRGYGDYVYLFKPASK